VGLCAGLDLGDRIKAHDEIAGWPGTDPRVVLAVWLYATMEAKAHPLGSLVVHDRAPTAASSSRSISLLSTDKWGRTAQPG
jgi:hypothetical protein